MKKNPLPKVLLLYTGGTIGMEERLELPDLSQESLEKRFFDWVPEISKIAQCHVDILFNKDSSHLGKAEWKLIRDRVLENQKKFDAVVVLHGTDTLAYTASALSVLLNPTLIPVVITGAQKPLASVRSDARRNLFTSVEIATHLPKKLASEVLVFFDRNLFLGHTVRKISATQFEAFESPKSLPLASVGSEIVFNSENFYSLPWKKVLGEVSRRQSHFENGFFEVRLTPDFDASPFTDDFLKTISGMVLHVFASGTAPTHLNSFREFLKRLKKRKIPVLLISDAKGVSPALETYPAAKPFLEILGSSVYFARSFTPEFLFVLFSYLKGSGLKDPVSILKKIAALEND